MNTIRTFLEAQPLLALFLAIGTGYALGQVSIFGFALGAGAVLFTGLLIGAIAPKATPPGMVGTLGLLMFLYGVGIQYGRQFFAGLAGPGLAWNALGFVGVVASLLVALQAGAMLGLSVPLSVGLFAGSGTSTPTLQAALAAAGTADPAIGYSVSYPFGVIGPILVIYLATIILKPRIEQPLPTLRFGEVTVDREGIVGKQVDEVGRMLPPGVQVTGLRRSGHTMLPDAEIIIIHEDTLLLVGHPDAIAAATEMLGHPDPLRIVKDRSELDVVRVYVSKPAMLGRTIAQLPQPDFPIFISHVRRGDLEMLATPDLVVETGDRLVVLAPTSRLPQVRQHFGDSIRGNAEFSYISVGIGMVLGLALGAVPIPVPGLGTLSLGVAAGPLIMALFLGWLGRTGPIGWRIPAPANLVLRNLGLTLFLASVAIGAGRPFVATVSSTGLPILLAGAAVLLTNVLIVLLIGYAVMKLPFDAMIGVLSGTTGNPAIPAYASRLLQSERVDIGYATIFPSMTIVKVVAAQVAIALYSGSPG
jgi:putative transport protein